MRTSAKDSEIRVLRERAEKAEKDVGRLYYALQKLHAEAVVRCVDSKDPLSASCSLAWQSLKEVDNNGPGASHARKDLQPD